MISNRLRERHLARTGHEYVPQRVRSSWRLQNGQKKSGKSRVCRLCWSMQMKRWYREHLSEMQAYHRLYNWRRRTASRGVPLFEAPVRCEMPVGLM